MGNLSQDSQSLSQDLNMRPEYDAGVLTTQPSHAVFLEISCRTGTSC
jgi:hypothetical protein